MWGAPKAGKLPTGEDCSVIVLDTEVGASAPNSMQKVECFIRLFA